MTTHALPPIGGSWRKYGVSLVVGLALLFLLMLDQGQTLSIIQGDLAYAQNLIHEAVHDARHTAAVPCH
jgi:hypothetical protein